MRRILNRIEKIKDKHDLIKIQQIILNELEKDYYKNAANVKEMHFIKSELISSTTSDNVYKNIYYREIMAIYNNGFITFESHNLSCSGIVRHERSLRKR